VALSLPERSLVDGRCGRHIGDASDWWRQRPVAKSPAMTGSGPIAPFALMRGHLVRPPSQALPAGIQSAPMDLGRPKEA